MDSWLTIVGGAFEIAGFALVAYELYRIQRQEFGTPEFIEKGVLWLRRIFRRPRDQTIHARSSAVILGRGRTSVRIRHGPGISVKERIEVLERNFKSLENEIHERIAEHNKSLDEVKSEVKDVRRELEQHQAEAEEKRKMTLQSSIAIQAWGTVLFAGGTILSVLGNVL